MPQDEIASLHGHRADGLQVPSDEGQGLRVFINEDFDDKGAICLREWAEQGNVPATSSRASTRALPCSVFLSGRFIRTCRMASLGPAAPVDRTPLERRRLVDGSGLLLRC